MPDPVSTIGTAASLVQLATAFIVEPDWDDQLEKETAEVLEEREGFSVSRRALRRWLAAEGEQLVLGLILPEYPRSQIPSPILSYRSTRRGHRPYAASVFRIACIARDSCSSAGGAAMEIGLTAVWAVIRMTGCGRRRAPVMDG